MLETRILLTTNKTNHWIQLMVNLGQEVPGIRIQVQIQFRSLRLQMLSTIMVLFACYKLV